MVGHPAGAFGTQNAEQLFRMNQLQEVQNLQQAEKKQNIDDKIDVLLNFLMDIAIAEIKKEDENS